MSRLLPAKFDYEPIPPFHTARITLGSDTTTIATDNLADAVNTIYAGDYIFGAVIDAAGFPVACYREGFMTGVSAVFEIISAMTVEHGNSVAYEALLQVEMHWRTRWPRL